MEFGALPGGEKCPTAIKNTRDNDAISIVLTPHVLHKVRRCRPRQQDSPPLPKIPPDAPCTYDHVGGVCIALPPPRAPTEKKLLFFALSRACQYRTVTATSRRGSSVRFDGDIRYVIIDVSLLRRRVTLSG